MFSLKSIFSVVCLLKYIAPVAQSGNTEDLLLKPLYDKHNYGIFKTEESARKCLCYAKGQVTEKLFDLLDIINTKDGAPPPSKNRYPFIVVDGDRFTRKSTLSRALADSINGTYFETPFPALAKYVVYFNTFILRQVFLTLSNYAKSFYAKSAVENAPVVTDEFWTHNIVEGFRKKNSFNKNFTLPLHTDEVYKWPYDLMKPDLLIYLIAEPAINCPLGPLCVKQPPEIRSHAEQVVFETVFQLRNPSVLLVLDRGKVHTVFKLILKYVEKQLKKGFNLQFVDKTITLYK